MDGSRYRQSHVRKKSYKATSPREQANRARINYVTDERAWKRTLAYLRFNARPLVESNPDLDIQNWTYHTLKVV